MTSNTPAAEDSAGEDSAADIADEDIAERLRQAIGRFVRTTRAHADTLPRTRSEALGALGREGPQTIAQLAAGRGVRHQSMSRIVGELESLGLVGREASPGDGRAFLITLTVQGAAALDADRLARRRWMAHAIATRLSPAEREMLNAVPALLDRLSAAGGTASGTAGDSAGEGVGAGGTAVGSAREGVGDGETAAGSAGEGVGAGGTAVGSVGEGVGAGGGEPGVVKRG